MGLGIFRLETQSLAAAGLGFGEPTECGEHIAQGVVHLGISRCPEQALQATGFRLLQPAEMSERHGQRIVRRGEIGPSARKFGRQCNGVLEFSLLKTQYAEIMQRTDLVSGLLAVSNSIKFFSLIEITLLVQGRGAQKCLRWEQSIHSTDLPSKYTR